MAGKKHHKKVREHTRHKKVREHTRHKKVREHTRRLYRLFEANGPVCGHFARGLQQMLVRLRILQLCRLDPAQVVLEAGDVVVVHRLRERQLPHQLLRLVVQIVLDVAAEQRVDQRGLALFVLAQSGRTETWKKKTTNGAQFSVHFLSARVEKVDAGREGIHRATGVGDDFPDERIRTDQRLQNHKNATAIKSKSQKKSSTANARSIDWLIDYTQPNQSINQSINQ